MNVFRLLWVRAMRSARDEYKETHNDIVRANPVFRAVLQLTLVYIVAAIIMGVYWSFEPAPPSVHGAVRRELVQANLNTSTNFPKGVATTSALIALSKTLLNKPGGYLANDVFPPGLWLDNMPHWELGVVQQVRDTTKNLRESFSQSSLKHNQDVNLQKAEIRFNFSSRSWGFPASESQYRSGIEHLHAYNQRLLKPGNDDAEFNADAQHLNDYLAGVELGLKTLSQRLIASIGARLDADTLALQQANKNSIVTGLYTKTPWSQIDDVFYEARGSVWALIIMLQAIEVDFADVLQAHKAEASFEQIIRELAPSQKIVLSPVILNGEGFGVVANHSLSMASYLSRAQTAIADCRRQLLVKSP